MKLLLHCLVRINGVVLDLAKGLLPFYRTLANSIQIFMVLGAFAKFRKATMSVVYPFFRLSVRMEQLCSHWTGFHEIWYLSIFRKYVEKIQVLYLRTNVYF